MPERCLLYYITDSSGFPGGEHARQERLLEKIAEAAAAGVDYIQLREKHLTTRELESLARQAVAVLRSVTAENQETTAKTNTALLINSRTDVALAVGADGVHLRSADILAGEVRSAWAKPWATAASREASPNIPLISLSCHTAQEVMQAAEDGATLALFAPVFEKKDAPGNMPAGLAALEQACRATIPVLALGGVTLENTAACLRAGAAGIAAIRLFQENDVAETLRVLRAFPRPEGGLGSASV
jgi:thiamine-phosphate pyrophosphorylase